MADKKISQLTAASTPLAGTEVLPIVQSGSTVKVSSDDLTVKNVRSNATSGILQVVGPAAAATRTMTVPDANFTVARTDAAQNFTGSNTFDTSTLAIDATNDRVGVGLTNPSYRLHVQGVAGAVSGTARATVLIDDTTAYAANVGGAITLRGKYNAAGDYAAGGYVQAQKTNATDGNDSFDVVLGTRENGNGAAEALRLTDTKDVKVTTGNLLIGTSGKGINDANNNELFKFTATASAVNELTVANAATGNNPAISATGDDTNIGINLTPKGTGSLRLTAGNFGVNVTPSAWDSGFEVIENTGGAFYSGSVNGISLGQNIYYGSGAFKYKTTNLASRLLFDAGAFKFSTAPSGTGGTNVTLTEVVRISNVGNVSIGGTATRGTTVGTAALNIFNGTAPAGTLTNGISIYSSSGEAYVMDAAGNATLFSPHDSETNEWIFKSKHTPTGKVLRIDVEKLLRFVNDHFGLDAVKEFVEE